jgi:hypothetical protein
MCTIYMYIVYIYTTTLKHTHTHTHTHLRRVRGTVCCVANAARTRIQSGASIVIIAGYVYFSFIILKKFRGQYGDICGIRVCLLHEPLTVKGFVKQTPVKGGGGINCWC